MRGGKKIVKINNCLLVFNQDLDNNKHVRHSNPGALNILSTSSLISPYYQGDPTIFDEDISPIKASNLWTNIGDKGRGR